MRTKLLTGEISFEREQELIENTVEWLKAKSEEFPVYDEYLKECRDWNNPWIEEEQGEKEIQPTDQATTNDNETPQTEAPTAETKNETPEPTS